MTRTGRIAATRTERFALAARIPAILLGTLLAVCSHAQTTQRMAVTEVRPLLKLAIEHGAARGVLTGAGADYVRRRFDATAPIEIDVTRLHDLPQHGCARLEIITRQREVLEHGERADQELRWQVSFCRDGTLAGEE
mgnify:CR=1 FL=1